MILVFFMDGVKLEMAEKHMPFVSKLNMLPLISEFGYSCACHATMYTSRYIDEHHTWFVWKKGDNSPYQWVNKVPLLKYLNILPVKIAVGQVTKRIKKNSSFPGIPMLVNLPLKYWGLFETCEDKFWTDELYKPELPNLFTLLKKHGVRRRLVALSKNGDPFAEEKNVDYKNDEFVYFFIGSTDNYMHEYGENGEEIHDYLLKTDGFIQSAYEKACREQDDVTVICYSDHGHINVREPKIDINKYFRTEGLEVNRYIHLIESTFARFWFRNTKEEEDIKRVLGKMEEQGLGFVLGRGHLDAYHLNFNSNEHGDVIFHLNAPQAFTKTIWGFGKTVKSMHGYLPSLPKHYGFFASNRKLSENDGSASLADVLPTILARLEIDPAQYVFRGKNIVAQDSELVQI